MSTTPTASSGSSVKEQTATTFTPRYRNYILFILTGMYVFSFIDRQILVILQESIKQELGLSDTQLGLMTGFTFAIFYVTFGIPIARLADRKSRKHIMSISLAVWSGMTALSGMAQNFVQLLLARIGVGIGEAGASPPAHSLISDLFPAHKRATALSIYSTGISIGILLGFLVGGWINQYFGWRVAFFVVGIPGILYAILLFFSVKEPPRGLSDGLQATGEAESLQEVLRVLWGSKAFRWLALGSAMAAYAAYATMTWLPPFLFRIHQMESGDIGTWLALMIGVGGGIGYFGGGFLSDYLGRAEKRWYLWLPALCLLLCIPFTLTTLFTTNTLVALWAIALPSAFISVYLGPCLALTHGIVKPQMRALASAILFFILNLIGLGLGPLVTGMVSDALEPSMGAESLRWALASSLLANVLGAGFFVIAARYIRADLR
ncbi:MAG: MFS transporter [Bacteroidota bacterium]